MASKLGWYAPPISGRASTSAGKIEPVSRAIAAPPAAYSISVAVGLTLTIRAGLAGIVTGRPIMSMISSGYVSATGSEVAVGSIVGTDVGAGVSVGAGVAPGSSVGTGVSAGTAVGAGVSSGVGVGSDGAGAGVSVAAGTDVAASSVDEPAHATMASTIANSSNKDNPQIRLGDIFFK